MQASTHPGDPVYLLATTATYADGEFVYRSTDAGQPGPCWPSVLPNAAPPASAPRPVFVKAIEHSVVPIFMPLYRALGLASLATR